MLTVEEIRRLSPAARDVLRQLNHHPDRDFRAEDLEIGHLSVTTLRRALTELWQRGGCTRQRAGQLGYVYRAHPTPAPRAARSQQVTLTVTVHGDLDDPAHVAALQWAVRAALRHHNAYAARPDSPWQIAEHTLEVTGIRPTQAPTAA